MSPATSQRERLEAALADRYRIVREIGAGGMATVFLAKDLKHQRHVALKVVRPEVSHAMGAERFLREIELVANLSHPHILPLHDSGEAAGALFFVMPYVEGGTLRDRLKREGRLPVEEALRIARQVADALDYAHRQDVVHRDIKPENILLSEGHALVADFGIGKAVCDVCDDNLSVSGAPIGTPDYMSPEQALGEEVDARTDVYGLACVLFEALTEQPPYAAANARATLMRHVSGPIPSARELREDVPPFVEAALARALAKSTSDRFETASLFGRALMLDPTITTTQPIDHPAPPRRHWTRHPVSVVAAGVAVLATAIGWWMIGSADARRSVESLAVLPLEDLSEDSTRQYFAAGMHDALIAEIAQIGALSVISRTSVLRYRDTEVPIPEIAAELGVDAVLEGSVIRHGDSVRVIAQLIGLDPERHLWSGTFDRDARDLLLVHAEVARAIAREIRAELTPEEEARLASERPLDPATLDSYLRGRFHTAQGSIEGFRRAISAFEQVTAQAPDFAPAHSGVALATHLLGFYGGVPQRVAEPRAKAAAERALQRDPDLAEARAVLGGIRSMYEWDWEGAERDYELAIRADPSSSIARRWYAYHLSAMGRHEQAVAEAQRGVELDPVNPFAWFVLAEQFVFARDYDRAVESLRRALELEPLMQQAATTLEDVFALRDQHAQAVALRRARLLVAGDSLGRSQLDAAWEASGPQGYWRWRLERLRAVADTAYVAPRRFVKVHAALGNVAEAARWLERAYEAHDGMELLRVSPFYDPLRGFSGFEAVVERMDFPSGPSGEPDGA